MSCQQTYRKRLRASVAGIACAVAATVVIGASPVLGAGCFQGQETVRWIVPYSPGGGFDTYSRLVEPYFEKQIGAEVVIRNVTGAGGINGFRELYRSTPDGKTVGIVFGSGIIVAHLIDKMKVTLSDFSLLGRIAPEQPVWVLGKDSPFKDIYDLIKSDKPVIGVTTGAGSASFFDEVVAADLIGVYDRFKAVTGFKGSRQATMAIIRNEADLGDYNYSSVRDRIDSGDLRPVMAVTGKPVGTDNPNMKGVPTIADVLKKVGRDDRIEDARALSSINDVARVIAAPPGMDPKMFQCLSEGLYAAMTSDGFKQAAKTAKRPIDPERGSGLKASLEQAVGGAKKFSELYKDAVAKIGG